MGIRLGVALPLIILAYVAYYFFAPGPESAFSKNFSLEAVLRKLLSAELDCPANTSMFSIFSLISFYFWQIISISDLSIVRVAVDAKGLVFAEV